MTRTIIALFVALLLPIAAHGESRVQIDRLYGLLAQEDWVAAKESAQSMLSAYQEEDETTAAIRYCYIYSLAGMVATDKMSFRDLQLETTKMTGHKVLTFAYTLNEQYQKNTFQAFINKDQNKIQIFAANRNATNIFAFIDVPLDSKYAERYVNQSCHFYGSIVSIEIHDSPLKAWLMRITLGPTTIIPRK